MAPKILAVRAPQRDTGRLGLTKLVDGLRNPRPCPRWHLARHLSRPRPPGFLWLQVQLAGLVPLCGRTQLTRLLFWAAGREWAEPRSPEGGAGR